MDQRKYRNFRDNLTWDALLMESAATQRKKELYLKHKKRLLDLINDYDENLDDYKNRAIRDNKEIIDRALSCKFIGGGLETFESRWKAITITTPVGDTRNLEQFKNKIIKFFNNKQWEQLIFTIEHISSNMHAHIAAKFTSTSGKKAKRLYNSLNAKKHFGGSGYDISKYCNFKGKKQLHLNSKSNHQISKWIAYILKEFDRDGKSEWKDKKIYYHNDYWERVLSFNEDTKYDVEKFDIKF